MQGDSVLKVVLFHLLGHGSMKVSANHPRGDTIDPNVVVCELVGQCAG